MALEEGLSDGSSGGRTAYAATLYDATPAAERMAGLWTLRFGPFGCRDDETEGGILHIEGDRMAGDDGQCLYHGRFALNDETLDASLEVVCHEQPSTMFRPFGMTEPTSHIDFTAEAITPSHFEGRIAHGEGPGIRIIMRRVEKGEGAARA